MRWDGKMRSLLEKFSIVKQSMRGNYKDLRHFNIPLYIILKDCHFVSLVMTRYSERLYEPYENGIGRSYLLLIIIKIL